jgi:hypothetical protein
MFVVLLPWQLVWAILQRVSPSYATTELTSQYVGLLISKPDAIKAAIATIRATNIFVAVRIVFSLIDNG